MSKGNNHPIGENSPTLVTLLAVNVCSDAARWQQKRLTEEIVVKLLPSHPESFCLILFLRQRNAKTQRYPLKYMYIVPKAK
jgi:hypothetical protein